MCGLFLPKNNSSEVFSIICIFLNSIVVFFFIEKSFKREYKFIVLLGYFLRIILLFADYYKWFPILHSGGDSEDFHQTALKIMQYGFQRTFIYSNYEYFTGLIYLLIGPQRFFLQYINVLFGMGTLYYIYYTFQLLNLSKKTTRLFFIISCLMPQLIIFSGILLRESILIYATSASAYFFVKWILKNNTYHFLFSVCFILIATWLHSGMIGVLIGYLIASISYDRKEKKIKFSYRSVIPLFLCLFFIIYLVNKGIFTTYFNSTFDNDRGMTSAILEKANGVSYAGSRYLTWINVDSPTQLLLFSPLKMFYFLFSPIPFDWRSVSDIVAFFLDSVFLLYFTFLIFSGAKLITSSIKKNVFIFLLISFLFTVFIYGYGTYASGTAMRHRTNIFPILVTCAAIAYDYKLQYHKLLKTKLL